MSYGVRDFFNAAPGLDAQLRWGLGEVARRKQGHQTTVQKLTADRQSMIDQLARYLLPDLSRASTDRAGALMVLTDLMHGKPQKQLEDVRVQLEKRVAEIEADPRWIEREVRKVRADTELGELREFRAPLADVLARSTHERLDRLIGVGYDTPEYAVGWWRASYYADWKAGDEILAQFPEKTAFHEVREAVLSARSAVVEYDRMIGTLEGKLSEIATLEGERSYSQERLAHLHDEVLGNCRQWLTEHIRNLDPDSLAKRFGDDPSAALLAKTIVGIGKKIEYLNDLATSELDPMESRLRGDLAKLERDRRKYSRPKKAWTQFQTDKFQKRFRDRRPWFDKRWDRYDRTYNTVYVFDNYDRGSLVDDFLWWDLMTDGRIDGSFSPSVQSFHRQYPNYRWSRDDDDSAAAVATVAAMQSADDLSAFDPS